MTILHDEFAPPRETHGSEAAVQLASSPPTSTSSSPKSPTVSQRRSASPLSLDLASLPPPSQPAPPSNTLLITQLNDPTIFHPASLATIRQHITSISSLHSFSPLKSFRRIVCSFYDVDSAIRIRQHLDGATLLGDSRARIYFGEPTPIGEQKKYLERPDAGRLFFISPPPSPPVGWEAREEGAPNKEVVASDLAMALGKLSGKLQNTSSDAEIDSTQPVEEDAMEGVDYTSGSNDAYATSSSKPSSATATRNRSRSSTIIYDPEAHGDSPALPAVMVEDTTTVDDDLDDDDANTLENSKPDATKDMSPADGRRITAHTSRPPLELMEQA